MASNDKLRRTPPPEGLRAWPWRNQPSSEIAKVTPNMAHAIREPVDALSIKQRERNRCRLQFVRF